MTWALCLHCGATKFGAICPCPECSVNSTGNAHLDIAFSDHHLSEATLKAFGEVVRSIHRACDDRELCFWSFIYYVCTNHPDILEIDLSPEQQALCAAILASAKPPRVEVEESERALMLREIHKRY
jgi:hypothetical protein